MELVRDDLVIPVPWGTISGRVWGKPGYLPLLALHGIQDNCHSFDQLLPQIPNKFHCVCIDLPGHGRSSRLPDGIQLHFIDYVLAIKKVVDYLNWDKFFLMGHSIGGQLSVFFASIYPERVLKIVLIDGLSPSYVRKEDTIKHLREGLDFTETVQMKEKQREPPSYSLSEALEKLQNSRRSPITRKAAESLMKRALVESKGGYRFVSDQRLKFRLRPLISANQIMTIISGVKCEILLILASQTWNRIVDEVGPFLEERFEVFKKHTQFDYIIIDGNHNIHMNCPERFSGQVADFLLKVKSKL